MCCATPQRAPLRCAGARQRSPLARPPSAPVTPPRHRRRSEYYEPRRFRFDRVLGDAVGQAEVYEAVATRVGLLDGVMEGACLPR